MIVWQVDFSIIQGPTGKVWGAVFGTTVDNHDKGAYIVWGVCFQVGRTKTAAAAIDSKGISERCGRIGVDAESTVCSKECED